ncbi:MAG TPA: porin [Cyanothece sp. UBA12306]|nr:porin [Cyanothece sp. UBA12306]
MGCWQNNQFTATSIVNGLIINDNFSPKSNSQFLPQTIKQCPREFTGWDIIKTFETESYSLAICQQNNQFYLVGHEKQEHEAFIDAQVIIQNDTLIIAKDKKGLYIEISDNQLKITVNNQLIAQEIILNEKQETNIETLSNYQKASGLGGPSSVNNELREDAQKKESLFPEIDETFQPWFEFKENLSQDIGLTFGVDYNFLYQNLSQSAGLDEASGGMFRVFGNWTLLGRNTDAPGSVVFKVENRHIFAKIAPQNLGFETGYVGLTGTQFGDFGWGVTNLYWQQKFNDGKISFVIGKVDPTDYVGIYGLTNPVTHFQNLAFLTDPSIAVPNQGLGIAVGAMLSDNIYLIGGFSDANGEPTRDGFDTFFDDAEYFKHIELGWTSSFERRYFDNIHLTAWHVDEREKAQVPDSWGVAFSASWFIDDQWIPFLRMGYSEGEAALNERNISMGLGHYFSRNGNLLGVGLSWGKPTTDGLENQVTTELFHRIQMSQNWAITPDIQVIFDPALNPEKDVIAVFGIRSRLNF